MEKAKKLWLYFVANWLQFFGGYILGYGIALLVDITSKDFKMSMIFISLGIFLLGLSFYTKFYYRKNDSNRGNWADSCPW